MPKIYSRFDVPPAVRQGAGGPSMAQQHFSHDADINEIMARYQRTGILVDPMVTPSGDPLYGDFSAVVDFQSAQNVLVEASEAFARLPSSVRDRFGHSPEKLLAFLADKGNLEEARKLGLVEKEAPKAPEAPLEAPAQLPT